MESLEYLNHFWYLGNLSLNIKKIETLIHREKKRPHHSVRFFLHHFDCDKLCSLNVNSKKLNGKRNISSCLLLTIQLDIRVTTHTWRSSIREISKAIVNTQTGDVICILLCLSFLQNSMRGYFTDISQNLGTP